MKLLTLIALKRSIKKWERIVEGTGVDRGSSNCPLCKRFLHPRKAVSCRIVKTQEFCPVAKAGHIGCGNKEYLSWKDWFPDPAEDMAVYDEHTRFMAQQELNFLKSLLPEKKK